jgi:hypothetical protein
MSYRLGLSYRLLMSILSLSFIAAPALGADASRRTQEKAARKACLAGDYAKGVGILADLFVETREPIYVFNQGRCFEQNRRYEDAIGRFEEYLRMGETASLNEDDRAAAGKHIADCKSHLPEAQGMAPPPFVEPQPGVAPETTPQLVAQPKPQPEPRRGRSRLLVAGIVVAAVGVAAVGAGVAFNLKVNSMVNDMETKVDQYSESSASNRKTYETLGWVGYGVGAACIATGAVLIAVGAAARKRSSTNVALVPALGPDHAGVLLSGAF